MNLNHLMYFRTLARTEHYGKAAQELYISQPSLSYAISALERELGTKLFEKKGRNIVLTKYGQFFAQSVEKIFSDLETAEERLRKMTGSKSGHIYLSYYDTLGIHFVPGLIKAYLNRPENADVTFSLRQQVSADTIEGLLRGKIDIGLCSRIDPKKYSDIVVTPVKKDYFHILTSVNHPLASLQKVSLLELEQYPFVSFSKQSGLRPVIDEILSSWNICPTAVCEAEQGGSVAGIVAAGLGITLMPDIPLPEMDIVKIPLEEDVPPRITYLAVSKQRYQTDAVKSFCQFILDQCGYME